MRSGRVLIAILATITAVLLWAAQVSGAEVREMYLTCYCPESCPGIITASGERVREGIAAVGNEEDFGKVAVIWTEDGELLGYWHCLDRIGKPTRKVIDVWMPNMERAREMMALTGGRCKVEFLSVEWTDDVER